MSRLVLEGIHFGSAVTAASAIRRREISPVEWLTSHLERIHDFNPKVNALVTVDEESALTRAKELTRELTSGSVRGPLHGIPVAIKDLYDFKAGLRNTFGSIVFRDFVPDISVPYVTRLEAAGAVVVGKGNVSEFGHKAVTDNALFGPTSTPFNLDMNAGGSSGGCAAAVAAGFVGMAQGSDAGGSIRIPASFCGAVGMMPTSGAVGQLTRPDGFLGSALSVQSGPICRTVEDAAAMLGVMATPSQEDPLSVHVPWTSHDLNDAAASGDVRGLRIGVAQQLGDVKPEGDIPTSLENAARYLEQAGALVEVTDIHFRLSGEEAYGLWTRCLGVLYRSLLFGLNAQGVDLLASASPIEPSFREELERSMSLTLEQRIVDNVARTSLFETMMAEFSTYDVLLLPTVAVETIRNSRGSPTFGPTSVSGVNVSRLAGWAYTFYSNLTGLPALSVPCETSSSGVPIGLQIIANRFREPTMVRVASAIERGFPIRAQTVTEGDTLNQ